MATPDRAPQPARLDAVPRCADILTARHSPLQLRSGLHRSAHYRGTRASGLLCEAGILRCPRNLLSTAARAGRSYTHISCCVYTHRAKTILQASTRSRTYGRASKSLLGLVLTTIQKDRRAPPKPLARRPRSCPQRLYDSVRHSRSRCLQFSRRRNTEGQKKGDTSQPTSDRASSDVELTMAAVVLRFAPPDPAFLARGAELLGTTGSLATTSSAPRLHRLPSCPRSDAQSRTRLDILLLGRRPDKWTAAPLPFAADPQTCRSRPPLRRENGRCIRSGRLLINFWGATEYAAVLQYPMYARRAYGLCSTVRLSNHWCWRHTAYLEDGDEYHHSASKFGHTRLGIRIYARGMFASVVPWPTDGLAPRRGSEYGTPSCRSLWHCSWFGWELRLSAWRWSGRFFIQALSVYLQGFVSRANNL
jgi:hypothetical protein